MVAGALAVAPATAIAVVPVIGADADAELIALGKELDVRYDWKYRLERLTARNRAVPAARISNTLKSLSSTSAYRAPWPCELAPSRALRPGSHRGLPSSDIVSGWMRVGR
jgi:hypothetical protein